MPSDFGVLQVVCINFLMSHGLF